MSRKLENTAVVQIRRARCISLGTTIARRGMERAPWDHYLELHKFRYFCPWRLAPSTRKVRSIRAVVLCKVRGKLCEKVEFSCTPYVDSAFGHQMGVEPVSAARARRRLGCFMKMKRSTFDPQIIIGCKKVRDKFSPIPQKETRIQAKHQSWCKSGEQVVVGLKIRK
ncbi:hypothetical protein L228DRAFT_249520 [Xylona heveae TC161]|uniref:Uncharacterized protein n=1 Tax=Xylona heveae (strain CBS 132557 / TC161) TaxID=1328760 RepID=A0A165F8X9_XYLHT|nr:hypothetical protein L228DRAFT_249520 [Xylona heveae TC161]KZF20717.1 hypothetical protein L228DRAFT_249520 [Xylona heveae TC161]